MPARLASCDFHWRGRVSLLRLPLTPNDVRDFDGGRYEGDGKANDWAAVSLGARPGQCPSRLAEAGRIFRTAPRRPEEALS